MSFSQHKSPPASPSSSKGLIALFASHYNAANLLMIVMIIFGIAGLRYINTQVFPDVISDTITISIPWEGAAAAEVENNILKVVEPEVRFLEGVKDVTSYAYENSAQIMLEYRHNSDMQKALNDVEKAVNALSLLPEGADDPKVTFSRWRDRIARIAISGPFDEKALRPYVYKIRDELLDAGITSVQFEGLRDEEIEITLKESALARFGLTLDQISQKIAAAKIDVPSGKITGEIATMSAAFFIASLVEHSITFAFAKR